MATIIKSESLHQAPGAVRGVSYQFADMSREAEDYCRSVEREASKIVDAARRDAVGIRQEAEVAGRRAAEEAVHRLLDEKVASQMQTLAPALQAAVAEIAAAKQAWLRHWESAGVELALAIAGRLVRGEVARRPEIAAQWMRQSLELAAGSSEIVLHLNPVDAETAAPRVGVLAAATCPLATVRIVPDANVSPGGCRATTEFGVIDGQLEAQLDRIREELS